MFSHPFTHWPLAKSLSSTYDTGRAALPGSLKISLSIRLAPCMDFLHLLLPIAPYTVSGILKSVKVRFRKHYLENRCVHAADPD